MKSSSPSPDNFRESLIQAARNEGFPLAGALDLDSFDLAPHSSRYAEWLEQGYAGKMEYLKRGLERRKDPRAVFPTAQSILCVALPYPAASAGQLNSEKGPRYARYLRNTDYHDRMPEMLERAMQKLKTTFTDLEWKVCVDTSAILERSWAAAAGLGWIGKNTLLINPQWGSYLFLGEVLINRLVHQGPQALPDYCGNCTRCLNACPTQAFPRPHQLDSTRCISYWTLEMRAGNPPKERTPWIAGCDICQEVCPFNSKVTKSADEAPEPGATAVADWKTLLEETEEQYQNRVKHSALNRVKPAQFRRNLAWALESVLTTAHLPLRDLVKKKHTEEIDPSAKEAWNLCLIKIQEVEKRNP